MLTLAELIAPITLESFHAEYDDRKPLHIPARPGEDGKRDLLRWQEFNQLLGQQFAWTTHNLKLVYNSEPLPADQFCSEVQTTDGMTIRPAPGKVQSLLTMGASLVANDVQDRTPALRAVTESLSRAFAGIVGANVYCSFSGIQAFNSHYDLHHVFAVQTEGEKKWRLYANRADAPVEFPADGREFSKWMAENRGPLMQEVLMRPGDVLYLPRGWYHDALATDGASLHVTLSITPLYGRVLFRLLESAAMQDPAFRAWLRPVGETGGQALASQVADLGQRLAALTRRPEFVDEVAMAQERLTRRTPEFQLPARPPLTLYRPTGLIPPRVQGPARIAVEWIQTQQQVALEDMIAQFDFIPEKDLRAAVAEMERTGALARV